MQLMFHDDNCGELLDGSGMCPKCKFRPDMQSTGFRDVPNAEVVNALLRGHTFLQPYRVPLGGATSGGAVLATVERVAHKTRTFTFNPPLELIITEGVYCTAENDELDLCVVGVDRVGILVELGAHIAVVWDEYALEDPSVLTPAAQRLRQEALRRITVTEERTNGTNTERID